MIPLEQYHFKVKTKELFVAKQKLKTNASTIALQKGTIDMEKGDGNFSFWSPETGKCTALQNAKRVDPIMVTEKQEKECTVWYPHLIADSCSISNRNSRNVMMPQAPAEGWPMF